MATSVFNNEVRQLVLDTRTITEGENPAVEDGYPYPYSNEFGSTDLSMTSITFARVNIRQVVGEDWYRKYNTFGLRLRELQWDPSAAALALKDERDKHLCICVRGLMWANHRPVFANSGDSQFLYNFRFDNDPNVNGYVWRADDNAPIAPFKIQGDFEDIEVSYVHTGDYRSAPGFDFGDTAISTFPSQTFTFDIVPMQQPVPYELPTHVDQNPAKKLRFAHA